MAVGHLLLQSFWANEAIFQLMMLAYNLFLLFKIDMVRTTEYRQQIKTFRLKYIFLAGKIIRTARSVVMKLSERYPFGFVRLIAKKSPEMVKITRNFSKAHQTLSPVLMKMNVN